MGLRALIEGWLQRDAAAAPEAPPAPGASELQTLCERGTKHYQAGDFESARQIFVRILEHAHDHALAHRMLGLVSREQGQLEEALDSLQLAAHFAPEMPVVHAELAGVLRVLGRLGDAEAACSRALVLAPDLAEVHFESGSLAKARGNLDAAIASYVRALECNPRFVLAACNLGYVLHACGRFAEAQRVLEQAIERDPGIAEAHHNLGLALRELGDPARALQCFRRAAELKPGLAAILTASAHCLRDLGRLDEAIAEYDAVLARDPEFGDARINRCYARLAKGDFENGWAEYEQRFAATRTSPRNFPFPAWRGEPLSGKRILVYAEQGLGDEIMFASCLPEVLARADGCVIECSARLEALFRRSFPGAIVHGGAKSDGTAWLTSAGRIDCQASIGSLPRFLRPGMAAFPAHHGYLKPDPRRVKHWRDQLAATNRFNIGLSWRGGGSKTRGQLRSIDLRSLADALAGDGVRLVSLQYGPGAADVGSLEQGMVDEILADMNDDIDEVCALIAALDLIVSVDNTVVHLAGAIGRPVWVLLESAPEWRYLRAGDTMPWYPSARLFRQQVTGDWKGPLDGIRTAMVSTVRDARDA